MSDATAAIADLAEEDIEDLREEGLTETGAPLAAADDDLSFDSILVEEREVVTRSARKRKAYREATVRPQTRHEALAAEAEAGGLFEVEFEYPSLLERLITMEELHAIEGTNGLRSVSLFSGCKGSGTGFAWAGWNGLVSVEFVKAARDTIAANYPSVVVEPEEIAGIAKPLIGDLPISFYRQKNQKGVVHTPTVNWEESIGSVALRVKARQEEQLAAIAAAEKRGEEPPRFEPDAESLDLLRRLEEFRHEVSLTALRRARDRDPAAHIIFGEDIRGLDPAALLEVLGLAKGELDCLEGSPPCKSFSMSGLREGGWGQVLHYSDERDQRTDDLFIEYVRILQGLMPKSFIAENVAGLTMGAASVEVLEPLIRAFDEIGYRVEAKVLNAEEYGVPQTRPRVFIVGIRKDLVNRRTDRVATPRWPAKDAHGYTLEDAMAVWGESPAEEVRFFNLDRGPNGEQYESGRIWHALPIGASPENKAFQFLKCHPKRPVPTITATSAFNAPAAGPVHPYEPRKFTIHEMRFLFGFPRDFVFTGTLSQQGERLGRSVTPYVMMQLAGCIAEVLLASDSDGSLEF